MATADAESSTPIPTTETAATDGDSNISEEQWKAMDQVLKNVYAHRIEDGYDPSKLFQRKINKRQVPDYYEVIKEPMALSVVRSKVHAKEYKAFAEYVRDLTLITYNAQVYNRPDSGAYQDAIVIKEFIESELKRLVDEKIVTEDEAKQPYLGDIPTYEDPAAADEVEDEEEEEEEEDDEEPDDSDDEKPKRRRGARSTAAISKRDGGSKDDKDAKAVNDAESRKKRGRPPRVDTPMEARIKAIMKAIRKPRNGNNQLMVSHFERVPDKAAMPEYFNEIKNPMAMDLLKKKLKRKKYQSVDQFMKDVEVMFENAKSYNQDESQIYKDAVHLQKEARKAAEEEKKKPDTEYVMEDGRLPMPNGILHNGELWKVGDWVHIQNANDLTKPIVAQIYRTWQDSDGGKWVNACWYYRPEQTIHRFDRHFYENEVVKTGQYRDHPIDEVVDRCFVMFFTRYNKGRPRNFPSDKEIYVCEARYNEEKFKLNKIKTWASCLPDEVREKDYEMDMFDAPKKIKKVPSPIAYLLKDDAKETDDLPKPEWGAENAPPKIGAVHKRPRDPKESPPPEPTPTPPPQPPPPPPRQPSTMSAHAPNGYAPDQRHDYNMGGHVSQTPGPTAGVPPMQTQPAYTPQPQSYHQHSASPAPPMPALAASHSVSYPPAMTPQAGYAPAPMTAPMSTYPTPLPSAAYTQNAVRPPLGYKAPQAIEVYRLDDHTNATIPAEIRDQFQRDEQGRLLFFTAPPLDPLPQVKQGAALGHSARYLAAKAKREALVKEKRKREAEEGAGGQQAAGQKRAKTEAEKALSASVEQLKARALQVLEGQLASATTAQFRSLFGEDWKKGADAEIERVARAQAEAAKRQLELERRARRVAEQSTVALKGLTVMLDDEY